MSIKGLLDLSMVSVFFVLVRFFDNKRKERRVTEKLNSLALTRLKREMAITFIFVVFYVIRVIVTDIGY